jgi:hypothetical protein
LKKYERQDVTDWKIASLRSATPFGQRPGVLRMASNYTPPTTTTTTSTTISITAITTTTMTTASTPYSTLPTTHTAPIATTTMSIT